MEQFIPNFRDKQVRSSVKKLSLFAGSIVVLPLVLMFSTKVALESEILDVF